MARPAGEIRPTVSRRVVLVTPYALSVYGGVQEQVLAMSRELARRDWSVEIVAPDSRDHATYDTPSTVHRVGRLTSLRANGSRAPVTLSPSASRRAAALIRRVRPSVTHFHEPFAPLLGWSALREHVAPSVGTFHRGGAGPATRWTGPVQRHLARHLDVVVAVSASAAATMGAASGLAPEVLFNGFELDRFTTVARHVPDSVTIGVVGRLEERKGVATAIRAVRGHNERSTTRWRLSVVGEGPERDRLATLAKGDPSIEFLGALDDVAKRSWMRACSVIVTPALRGESFGLVLLEAMASEVPLVASDIDGYREAAGGCAILVAPGDADALERGIDAALSAPPSQLAAATSHAAQWSMARLVDEYETRYDVARHRYDRAR